MEEFKHIYSSKKSPFVFLLFILPVLIFCLILVIFELRHSGFYKELSQNKIDTAVLGETTQVK